MNIWRTDKGMYSLPGSTFSAYKLTEDNERDYGMKACLTAGYPLLRRDLMTKKQ